MILTAIAILLAQPVSWTPFNDHLVSNAQALDVCAERDNVDGCMADAHRAIICAGYLAARRPDADQRLETTCIRIVCRSEYTDDEVEQIRARYCRPANHASLCRAERIAAREGLIGTAPTNEEAEAGIGEDNPTPFCSCEKRLSASHPLVTTRRLTCSSDFRPHSRPPY